MRSYIRVFHDPTKLEEMITLRKQGWNLSQLARYYGVDHTSIRHHCVRLDLLNITPTRSGEVSQIPRGKRTTVPNPEEDNWYIDEYGEKVFRGKSYQEIRAEAELRKAKKQTPRIEFYVNWKSQNGYF